MGKKLLERLAAHDEERQLWPWEVAAQEHQAKLDGMMATVKQWEAQLSATAKERAATSNRLAELQAGAAGVELVDFDAWANDYNLQTAKAQGLAWRRQMLENNLEAAKRNLRAASGNNPAPTVRADYIGNLRGILGSGASEKEKRAAYDELARIEESERPHIEEIRPPGFDASRYDSKGNLIR